MKLSEKDRAVNQMGDNSPFPIRVHDCVWLIAEGVLGEQPPKGSMLWVESIFEVEKGSLEFGPPGKYACCMYLNKFVYVSLEKLCAIHSGQWVRFELHKCIHVGQISRTGFPTKIIRIKPLCNGHHTISFLGVGDFMSLVEEPRNHIGEAVENRQCIACKFYDEDDTWREDEYAWERERCYWCEITSEDAFEKEDDTKVEARLEEAQNEQSADV